MSRRRYPGILDPIELGRPSSSPARSAPTAFESIAHKFEQIDRAMLDEMQADIDRRAQHGEESNHPQTSTSRFSDTLLSDTRYGDTQTYKDVKSYIEEVKKGASRASIDRETFAYLTDLKCETAWSWVYNAVWEHQNIDRLHGGPQWAQAKARSNEILTFALAVLDIYDNDESQDLLEPGRENVSAGIEAKLRTLSLFDSVFSRLTEDEKTRHWAPVHHAFKSSFDAFLLAKKERVKGDRKERYATTHQNRNIFLVTATVVSIAISVFPLGLAFHTSTIAAPGSTSDADFWLLIQNSLMQVLGLATTTLISLVPRPRKQSILAWPNLLIWTIAILGLGSALSAPLLYVRIRPIYSALISFLASAAQACMVLQLALLVDVGGKGAKMD